MRKQLASHHSNDRVGHPSDVVSRGDPVKVKVVSVEDRRIALSMKEVDQDSGRDLASTAISDYATATRNPDRPQTSLTGIKMSSSQKKGKRFTSPERFEIKQLIASGVLDPKDYPNFDEEHGLLHVEEEGDVDFDIEVRQDEPTFLAGQTKASLQLSPIRIVKNPDGSMNRAAMAAASLAKERRDLRQQQAIAKVKGDEEDEDEDDKKGGPEWKKKVWVFDSCNCRSSTKILRMGKLLVCLSGNKDNPFRFSN